MGLGMEFEFVTSNKIIFGNGTLSRVEKIVPELGRKVLIVTGGGSVSMEGLCKLLKTAGVDWEVFRVGREPDVSIINAGVTKIKSSDCDFVIGFGGGSVLDAAKAMAALMTNSGDLMDYLEVIGKGNKIGNPAAPMIALPTTAGTGTEVTRNAVISSAENQVKVSMRSPKMIPTIAIVDPELTYSMPPSLTASTGMDALTQVIEAYVSNKANLMTDIIAKEGIKRGGRSLLAAFKDGTDTKARENMALTSLFGGLALANGGLGAVHGFAGPIGGMFNAPHGQICASLLPHVMKYNVKILRELDAVDTTLFRYQKISQWLIGDSNATIEDGIQWVDALAKSLDVPRLRDIGIEQADFDQIIGKSKVSSSMQKNPVRLDDSSLRAILNEAY